MKSDQSSRRNFLALATATGSAMLLTGCAKESAEKQSKKPVKAEKGAEKGGEVTATEYLMREHGVLRRALIVYSESAPKLRATPSAVSPEALQKTAKLFRAFGEEYHEKML